jgi:hypothetical protein
MMELGLRSRNTVREKLNEKIQADISVAVSGNDTENMEKALKDAMEMVEEYPQTMKESRRPVEAAVAFVRTKDSAAFESAKKSITENGSENEKRLLVKLDVVLRRN